MPNDMNRDDISRALVESSDRLINRQGHPALLAALREKFPTNEFFFEIWGIPDQAEDIYHVVVSDREMAIVELPRGQREGEPPSMEMLSIREYSGGWHASYEEHKNDIDAAILIFGRAGF